MRLCSTVFVDDQDGIGVDVAGHLYLSMWATSTVGFNGVLVWVVDIVGKVRGGRVRRWLLAYILE